MITATLVVDFSYSVTSDSDNDVLQLEIDSRPDGTNGGKTSGFGFGATVGYLMYKSSGLSLIKHVSDVGSIGHAGSGTIQILNERLIYSGSDSATLKYPTSAIDFNWSGKSFDVKGSAKTIRRNLQNDNQVRLSEPAYGIAYVNYTASFDVFRLSSVPDNVETAMIIAIAR